MASRAPSEARGVLLVIPVKNTFVHFGVSDDRKRSQSAPPGLCHVARRPKRRPARKRWAKRDDDAEALKEYARVAKEEKWKQLAARALDEDRARDRALARTIAVVSDIEIFTPKLRESLEDRVFNEMVRAAFHDVRDVETLKRMGVLRGKGGRIEFWCADALLMHPTMQALLCEARRYRRMPRSSVTRVWI